MHFFAYQKKRREMEDEEKKERSASSSRNETGEFFLSSLERVEMALLDREEKEE